MQSRVAIEMTDAAQVALFAYQQVVGNLEAGLLATTSGQGLQQLGFGPDVSYSAELNVSLLVPRFAAGRLTVERP